MSYFDLHLHPAFKAFLCHFDAAYPTARPAADLTGPLRLEHPVTRWLDATILPILGSQACPDQLGQGGARLGVAAIAPMELAFVDRRGFFGNLLHSAPLTRPLDVTYATRIWHGELSYYQLFLRELSVYRALRAAGIVHLLNRRQPPDWDALAGDTLYLALGLEGGHGLCRTKINRPAEPDTTLPVRQPDALTEDFARYPALNPAEGLRHLQAALWQEGLDLFYLTLTHLTHVTGQHLATHAYGAKMTQSDSIYPRGAGLTYLGRQVVDAACTLTVSGDDGEVPAPVLIDVKHLSLRARQELYAYRRARRYAQPLLATHVGVTGYGLAEWRAALEEAHLVRLGAGEKVVRMQTRRQVAGAWGLVNRTLTFNAWTINLLDEDIREILLSGGLIGLCLDVRILGWQPALNRGDRAEYLSTEEFRHWFPDRYARLPGATEEAPESFAVPTADEQHPLALCFNLLHILSVGQLMTDADPWAQVCIGSDFDGLIQPLVQSPDASQLAAVEAALLRWLPTAETAYRAQNGGPALLPRTPAGDTDPAALRQCVRGVMYDNGRNFLRRWFQVPRVHSSTSNSESGASASNASSSVNA
jgi:microsomal dipeptidase-like Zn-dependent dipeptidase